MNHPLFHWVEVNQALRCVRIEFTDYLGPFPDSVFMEEVNIKTFKYNQKHPRSLIMENILKTALGGSPYVASNLMTRHGHYVGMF